MVMTDECKAHEAYKMCFLLSSSHGRNFSFYNIQYRGRVNTFKTARVVLYNSMHVIVAYDHRLVLLWESETEVV